jgi:putative membrane protein
MLHRTMCRSLLPAWCLVGFVVACEGRDRAGEAEESAAAAADTGIAPVDTTGATGSEAKLSDANIVALLDEANMADSAAGAAAATKATSKEVKDFARLMMSEHHALRQAGQQLAKQLKVTPEPPASDPLKPMAEGAMKTLESTPKGPEFDRTYIEQEVAAHKAVLDLANKAHDQAQKEQLKALIEKARPVIQKHLDQAEALQDKLGGPTT